MNIHVSYKISKTSNIEKEITHQIDKNSETTSSLPS